MLVEVLDERVDYLVRDQWPTRSVRRWLIPVHGKNAAQLVVGARHRAHRLSEDFANIRRSSLDIAPARALGNPKPMLTAPAEDGLLLLGELAALLAFELRDRVVRFVLPLVTEAFVEHQGEDVVLVILP